MNLKNFFEEKNICNEIILSIILVDLGENDLGYKEYKTTNSTIEIINNKTGEYYLQKILGVFK
jgi:hypothetical protein